MNPRLFKVFPGRIAFFLVLWMCGGLALRGYSGTTSAYSSRLWQMEDGLPHNIVQAVTQTSDGYLWVGTREGLARYDGFRFQSVELSSKIKHPSILCLLAGSDGKLWVGTQNSGLFQIQQGKVSRCPAIDGKQDFPVHELGEAAGAVWAGTVLGVLRYSGDTVQRVSDYRSGLQSMCVASNSSVWLVGSGFRRLDETNADGTISPNAASLEQVRKAYCDPIGVLWLATGSGLTRLSGNETNFFKKAEGPSGFISILLKDRQGVLWAGSYSGLSRFVDGTFVSEGESDEPSYRIYSLFEDREGTLWVGSEEGLRRLTPRAFRTYTRRDGLTLNTVVSVCATREGSVWIGAWGGGLNHFMNGQFHPFGKAEGLSSDFVMAMCEGYDGSLWVGTDYGSTLNQVRGNEVKHWGRSEGFMTAVTTALLEDNEHALWIGTRDGLQRFKEGKFSRFSTTNGLSHNKINALCQTHDRMLWIGTDAGLTRFDGRDMVHWTGQMQRLNSAIFALYEDAGGVLWIGTEGSGLLRLQDGMLTAFGTVQGLFSDSIYSIVEDDRANLWLNSSRGIFRLQKRNLDKIQSGENTMVNSIAYGKADGILSSGQYRDVTQPAACRDRDGRLWFRTTQGVAVVDPDKIVTNELPPPVVIQEILADKKVVELMGRQNSPAGEEPARNFITIAPGRGELEIRYAALSYRAPEKNQHKYKLAGVDPTWVEVGTRRVAYYNNLRPGKYRFEVMASNNDGLWNEKGDFITLILEPHFWQTWWFYTTCVLASMGSVGGAARYITRKKLQQKLALLQQQNALEQERARIARDIHDDIGAGLTEIALTSEIVEDPSVPAEETRQLAREISTRARELVTGMDEIVWAINPRNDTVKSAAAYFSQYAQRLLKSAGVSCRLDIEPDLPELPLASEQRHNLFLSFKEALNNVTKHAAATEVKLTIRIEDQVLLISVEDNGSGFGPEMSKLGADGLINMRERMARLGGKLAIISAASSGSRLDFRLPLPGPTLRR
jgi:ligand-binding sensor domain-containing protein/signal transduction histidine kinase